MVSHVLAAVFEQLKITNKDSNHAAAAPAPCLCPEQPDPGVRVAQSSTLLLAHVLSALGKRLRMRGDQWERQSPCCCRPPRPLPLP